MIHSDHSLHYSLLTINSHDLNQSSPVSVKMSMSHVKFQELGHDTQPAVQELDQSSSANGRAGPNMDSARPFTELDPRRIQLGRSPSWIDRNPSSPRPRNSSPEIASNSPLLRRNFTI
ncbi:hypothetical protein F2Q70_00002954 [Brassica cretica]|uniref:Uncharacterized protein n=1 Tax=Brassica cretica TaxID=69181 RepID=A0A8S9IN37_BRACR|nr:hypothetical protein F2Q70_00002954 [Brassica cretica]